MPKPSFRPWATAALLALVPVLAWAGEPAPPLTLQILKSSDAKGGSFSLAAQKGKVVLVDFWASWCGPCRKSMPALDQLQAKYKDQGLVVVGVSLDDDVANATNFLDRVPVSFTVLSDTAGTSAEAYHVVAMPTSFIVDAEGQIFARFEGGTHLDAEETAIKGLLKGAAPVPKADVRVASGLQATGSLKAWRRGHLADPIMDLNGDPLSQSLREHIHASKEASAGNGGAAGGGCGCN
jgi:thiol-disulfide isomerase/thioredoxin